MDKQSLMVGAPSSGGMPVAMPVAQTVPASASAGANLPVATTVAAAMPSAPPLASLSDQFSNLQVEVEESGEPPKLQGTYETASAPPADANFYTAEELKVLQSQAVPVDVCTSASFEGQLPTVQTAVPVVQAQPVLTTSVGVPIYTQQTRSTAITEQDGSEGVKSCDPCLTTVPEIMNFLNTYNARPRLACHVHGYHRERRHRTVHYTDDEGNRRTRREEYWETITDFDYKIDLTDFIFPFGYIQSTESGQSVPQLIESYLADGNMLKTLQMKKEIGFNFDALRGMVYGYIRSLGWRRGLTVSFPKANASTRIWSKNKLSTMWENCFCRCLCHVTIIPCIVMRCYRGDCSSNGSQQQGIRSFFQIQYHPLQVFEVIRPQLWCTGWSGAQMAAELIRNVFW